MRDARCHAGKPIASGQGPSLSSLDFTRYGVGVLSRGALAFFFFSFFLTFFLILPLDEIDDGFEVLEYSESPGSP